MGMRRMREAVLQTLYQHEFSKDEDISELYDYSIEFVKLRPDLIQLGRKYVKELVKAEKEIDALINEFLLNWRLERLSIVDRNILRMGTYELLYADNIPIQVTLNEMVEIAKRYGTENSGKFVNGILDRIAKSKCPKEKFLL